MSRSMVFWDTRCLLTRFACRKSVGQRTSRRSAGDASARTFRLVIVFLAPALRRAKGTGGSANSWRFIVADERAVWIGREY